MGRWGTPESREAKAKARAAASAAATAKAPPVAAPKPQPSVPAATPVPPPPPPSSATEAVPPPPPPKRSKAEPRVSPARAGSAPKRQAAARKTPPLPPPASGLQLQAAPGLRITCSSKSGADRVVEGCYVLQGSNHDSPVYRRDDTHSAQEVRLYYWRDEEHPEWSGWWIGPSVGGDEVWAYRHDDSPAKTPPMTGWRVPFDGPVDESMRVLCVWSNRAYAHRSGHRNEREQRADWSWSNHLPEDEREALCQVRRAAQRLRDSSTPESWDKLKGELVKARAAHFSLASCGPRKLAQVAEECEAALQAGEARARQTGEKRAEAAQVLEAVGDELHELEAKAQQAEEVCQILNDGLDAVPEGLIDAAESATAGLNEVLVDVNTFAQALRRKQELHDEHLEQQARGEFRGLHVRVAGIARSLTRHLAEVDAARRRASDELDKQAHGKALEKMVTLAEQDVEEAAERLRDLESMAKERSSEVEEPPDVALQHLQSLTNLVSSAVAAHEAISKTLRARFQDASRDQDGREAQQSLAELLRKHVGGRWHLHRLSSSVREWRERAERRMTGKRLPDKDIPEACSSAALREPTEESLGQNSVESGAKGGNDTTEDGAMALDEELTLAVAQQAQCAQLASRKDLAQRQLFSRYCSTGTELLANGDVVALARGEYSLELAEETLTEIMSRLAPVTYPRLPELQRRLATLTQRCEADGTEGQEPEPEEAPGSPKAANLLRLPVCVEAPVMQAAPLQLGQHGGLPEGLAVAVALRERMGLSFTGSQLFWEASKSGPLTLQRLSAFMGGNPSQEQLRRALQPGDTSAAAADVKDVGEISEESFLRILELHCRCVKATVLSEEVGISSKVIRRINEGELVIALGGILRVPGYRIRRLHCRTLLDGVEGWVTMAGDLGTVYLEPCCPPEDGRPRARPAEPA